MTKRIVLIMLALWAGTSFIGCTEDCTYPEVQTFSMRLLNAMPDQPKITVWLNGKLFQRNYAYDPPPNFGYISTYEDGSQLPIGEVSLVVTSDELGLDTLHKGVIRPLLTRQTLVIMGRGKKLLFTDTSSTAHALLNDEDVPQIPGVVQIRMLHAISDLPPIDVYFRELPTDGPPPTPDLTLSYRQLSTRLTISSLPGLTVTIAGDPTNVLFSTPVPFSASNFFISAILRGSKEPCDAEPVPAPLLLTDVEGGKVVLQFSVWGARFVNATKSQTLSLTGSNAATPTEPRGNIPGQSKVMNIPSDSASEYFGVGVLLLGNTHWFFSKNPITETVFDIQHKALVNERWTFVAFEDPTDLTDGIGGIVIKDTLACVPDAFGKARVVNLSPETGPVTVTIGSAPVMSLAQGQLALTTQSAGSKQVTITNGTLTQTHTINLPPARPISIYILPSKPGQAFPISISPD